MPLFEKLSNIQTFDPRWAEHNFHHFLPLSFTMRILTIHHSIAFAIAVIGRVKNIGFCVMLPSQFRSYLPASHHEMMSTAYGLKRKGSSSSSSYGILYCVIYWTRFLLCTSVRMCGLSFIFLFFFFCGSDDRVDGTCRTWHDSTNLDCLSHQLRAPPLAVCWARHSKSNPFLCTGIYRNWKGNCTKLAPFFFSFVFAEFFIFLVSKTFGSQFWNFRNVFWIGRHFDWVNHQPADDAS